MDSIGWKKQDRRVANLTTEQLYRKRAIDRENQRALRRTQKAQIDELAHEVERLRLCLQESEQDRNHLRTRQANDQRAIDAAISSLQSLQTSHGNVSLSSGAGATVEPEDFFPAPATDQAALNQSAAFTESSRGIWDLGSTVLIPFANSSHELDVGEFSLDLGELAMQTDIPDQGANLSIVTGSTSGAANDSERFDLARIEANNLRNEKSIWSILPTYCAPTCHMDELAIGLILDRKNLSQHGENTAEFARQSFPNVNSLLNPVLHEPNNPVSSTIARHIAKVINVHTFPEKVALLYMICILLRWNICTTQQNFEAIPRFLRPTPGQLFIQHPFWVNTIGWPEARSRIIQCMDFSKYQDFALAITSGFSVNWENGSLRILEQNLDGDLVLTDNFVDHIRDPANWTVNRALVEAFPFLEGSVNLH